ncbi:MAG: aminoacetone oxidase family FAD-binding enzyme [Lachnospiraceae bacterium]|nr:aminoacetone oxidase family FAD-binding enzyme [Lachnospiraceae bacterium]
MGLKTAIIGGGMSGLCAAILLAREGADVTVHERQEAPAKKLLLTGNGRCNLSNVSVSCSDYVCGDPAKLRGILACLTQTRRDEFFAGIGLMLCELRGGLYPASRQASSARDCLLLAAQELGVKLRTDSYVKGLDEDKRLLLRDGSLTEAYDIVIIASGGKAGVYGEEGENGKKLLRSIGHEMKNEHPALTHILCAEDLSAVAGVRCDAAVSLHVSSGTYRESGELQITKNALSGIPVFQLSRYLDEESGVLSVDFLPRAECDRVWFRKRLEEQKGRDLEGLLCGVLQKKLANWLITSFGRKPSDKVSSMDPAEADAFFEMLRNKRFTACGLGKYREAQLMSGGVPLDEVSDGLESRFREDVYLCGELLDVNGACGGYNLHFALASAFRVRDEILRKKR